jgi:hypothetical protein
MVVQGHKDLKVYRLAYQLAMQVFHVSKRFPFDERFALTDQPKYTAPGLMLF